MSNYGMVATSLLVSVRSFKDGFKSLQQYYYGPAQEGDSGFRNMQAKTYGYTAWDERQKMLDLAEEKPGIYIMKLRKNFSS